MALLTVQDVTRAGVAQTYAAVAASDTFANNGKCFVHVKNAGGSSDTVGFTAFNTVDGAAVAGKTVTVGATTGDKMIGPFPPEIYNDPETGLMTITHSFTTSVTIAVLRLT